VVFRLHLSEQAGSIIGRGEMVRHASRCQGGFDGVGVRFTGFAEDGAERLRRYLESRASKEAAAPPPEVEEAVERADLVTGIAPEFDPLQDPDLAAFFDSEPRGGDA
jgi:hypothetical protein